MGIKEIQFNGKNLNFVTYFLTIFLFNLRISVSNCHSFLNILMSLKMLKFFTGAHQMYLVENCDYWCLQLSSKKTNFF